MPKSRHPLQERAGELRKTPTEAEQRLWQHLRNRQVEDIKFRRQQPLEGYIVDFVSFEQRLVIELDGGQHAENPEHERERDACLFRNGFTVLRFWNHEIFTNMNGVLEVIRRACLEGNSPAPQPPPVKGGGDGL